MEMWGWPTGWPRARAIGKIRRMSLRDQLSLHEIAKRTGLSRNTIRRWLRTPTAAVPPTYRRVKGPSRLTTFHGALELALKADVHRSKQNRRTAKMLFAQIQAEGYIGSDSQVTHFIRHWRGHEGQRLTAFVPLKFELGEVFQFDWSEEGLVIGGIYRRIQVSHLKLCASRAFWLVAGWEKGVVEMAIPFLGRTCKIVGDAFGWRRSVGRSVPMTNSMPGSVNAVDHCGAKFATPSTRDLASPRC